eukprot:2225579-Pleurochrysis_carterae.AAC.4
MVSASRARSGLPACDELMSYTHEAILHQRAYGLQEDAAMLHGGAYEPVARGSSIHYATPGLVCLGVSEDELGAIDWRLHVTGQAQTRYSPWTCSSIQTHSRNAHECLWILTLAVTYSSYIPLPLSV